MDSRLSELFDRLSKGDREALREIYNAAGAKQFGVISRLVDDDMRAAEVLKTVYTDIWTRRHERAGASKGHLAWVMALTHRRAIAEVNTNGGRTNRARAATNGNVPTDSDLLRSAYLDATPLKDMARTCKQDEAQLKARLGAALAAIRAEGRS